MPQEYPQLPETLLPEWAKKPENDEARLRKLSQTISAARPLKPQGETFQERKKALFLCYFYLYINAYHNKSNAKKHFEKLANQLLRMLYLHRETQLWDKTAETTIIALLAIHLHFAGQHSRESYIACLFNLVCMNPPINNDLKIAIATYLISLHDTQQPNNRTLTPGQITAIYAQLAAFYKNYHPEDQKNGQHYQQAFERRYFTQYPEQNSQGLRVLLATMITAAEAAARIPPPRPPASQPAPEAKRLAVARSAP